jgi:hypothetical protein
VAVSKYKPAADLRACYDAGQRDFGENYAQELVEKAAVLPHDVRWHFIGTVQSNKAKVLAGQRSFLFFVCTYIDGSGGKLGIENLYAVQTLANTKIADALNRHRAAEHGPLRVFIQLNTSGEQTKGGIGILSSSVGGGEGEGEGEDEQIAQLATHIVRACPRLRLVGLMTIGKPGGGEEDFVALREARDRLVRVLSKDDDGGGGGGGGGVWGEEEDADSSGRGEEGVNTGGRRLLLSMGMSHDFEMALRAGADVVRVGTGIFGARPQKKGGTPAEQL